MRAWWRRQVCQAIGHDVDETTAHYEGRTIVAQGCLRCDTTIDVREFHGLYPLPRD